MYHLLSKIGKLLCHRMGIMLTMIIAQITLYIMLLLWLPRLDEEGNMPPSP